MIKITANQVSTSGTSNGQILTSNGTVAYWTTGGTGYTGSAGTGYAGSLGYVGSIGYTGSGASGGGFSNGQSISVANLAITGSLTANGSVGTSGQALVSTGTGIQWGALSPGYNYSSQFSGGNQYLGITASNAAFGFGTGDFTIEGWFYPTLNPANGVGTIFEFRTGTTSTACTMRINTSLQLVFYDGPANVETAFTTRTVSLNTWQHVAFVRIGNTVYGYINGLLAGSVAVTSNLGSSQPFYIGANQTAGYNYYGLASNVRVVKGTGIYTAAFTPPTSPLSAISGTSVLTCNAITPTSDSSTNAFQFTNGNGVTTTATLSPFTSTTVSIPTTSLTAVRQQFTGDGSTTTFAVAGGYTPNAISVFVNGVLLRNGTEVTVTNGSIVVFAIAPLSGALIDVIGTVPTTYSSITPVSYSTQFNNSNYLSVANATALNLAGVSWTIECWAYPTGDTSSYRTIWSKRIPSTGTASYQLYQNVTNGYLTFYNGTTVYSSSTALTLNVWSHIATVYDGTYINIYINGVRVLQSSTTITEQNTPFTIGTTSSSTSGSESYIGYISNLRVVKGVGIYTNAFTPPTSPLQAVQSAGPNVSAISGTQTSLLTCNGPTIIDGSTNAFTITNNGSAPVSTSIVPTFTNVTITGIPSPTAIGQVPFSTDGATWSSTSKIVQGTAVATTGATAIDFTSIPSWAKRITVMLNSVSTSGTSVPIVQIGSGSITASGYTSYAAIAGGTNVASGLTSTVGIALASASAANTFSVTITIFVYSGNIYFVTLSGSLFQGTAYYAMSGSSNVTLLGVLDRVRLTTTNGSDTFDAGSVNIIYE